MAEVHPQPAVPSTVRKLPPPLPGRRVDPPVGVATESVFSSAPAPTRPAVTRPLTAGTYKIQFTLTRAGYERLRRAQDLLRHNIPTGDAGAIFERALSWLVEDLEKRKLAKTGQPRTSRATKSHSRHIPAAVRREVWRRDEGRCAFVGTHGRCAERGFLEIHHVIPFADGGEATAENLELRCRAHNQHEAERWFGADVVKERPPGYASARTRSGPS